MKADYEKMKVAELKAIAASRNIYVEDMKKADIVATLASADSLDEKRELALAQEAEAVVIEPAHVELIPATINSAVYLDARREWVEQMMEPYRDMDDEAICAMDPAEAKACRADINRIVKEVDDERKAIKRAYGEPLARFEAAVKEMLEPAREASARLGSYIDDQEAARKDARRAELEDAYCAFCAGNGLESLPSLVPFDRLLAANPKWLNKGTSGAKAAREAEDIVLRIGRDWASLRSQRDFLRFYVEAEAEFFRTLDVGAALALDARRAEEQARIDAANAEREAIRAYREPEPEPVPEPEPEPEPEAAGQPCRKPYVLAIDLTDEEKAAVKDFLVSNGIGANRRFYPRAEGRKVA